MTARPFLGRVRRVLHHRHLAPALLLVNGALTASVDVLPFSDAGERALDAILVVLILGVLVLAARVIDAVVFSVRRATLDGEEVPP